MPTSSIKDEGKKEMLPRDSDTICISLALCLSVAWCLFAFSIIMLPNRLILAIVSIP
jgi:hypothetical protein